MITQLTDMKKVFIRSLYTIVYARKLDNGFWATHLGHFANSDIQEL